MMFEHTNHQLLHHVLTLWHLNQVPNVLSKRQGFKWPSHYFACYWQMTNVVITHLVQRYIMQ